MYDLRLKSRKVAGQWQVHYFKAYICMCKLRLMSHLDALLIHRSGVGGEGTAAGQVH